MRQAENIVSIYSKSTDKQIKFTLQTQIKDTFKLIPRSDSGHDQL